MYTKPICSLSFQPQARWSYVCGELYGGLPLAMPILFWTASGSWLFGLVSFVVVAVFTPCSLWRLVRWILAAPRRLMRPKAKPRPPGIVWLT